MKYASLARSYSLPSLIFGALLLSPSKTSSAPCTATDFPSLQTCIASLSKPITISNPSITWTANFALISYGPAFSTSQTTLNGNNAFRLFSFTGNLPASWTGDFTFTNGLYVPLTAGGAAIASGIGQTLTFNGSSTFTNNTLQSASPFGGALFLSTPSSATFNAPALFSNNSSKNIAGAIFVNASSSATFNSPAIFSGNSAILSGGGFYINTNATVTFNSTATFTGNTSGTRGGAIYSASGGIININNSATFSGNSPEGIYLANASTLNLNPPSGALISIQDGVASDTTANTITKSGAGTWQISGTNSTGYQGNTNISAGTFQLEPGAIYGQTTRGTVTIGSGGTVTFNVGGATLPTLKGNNIIFSGNGATTSVASITGSPSASITGIVAQAGTSISVNGSSATAGQILNRFQTSLYNATFIFNDPKNLSLIIAVIPPLSNPNSSGFHEICVCALNGNQNYINVARTLDAFDVMANQGDLAHYILAIEANPQDTLRLVGALVPEPQTASFTLVQNGVASFWNQIDQAQNEADSDRIGISSALNTNRRILLASVDKKLPLSSWSPTPWVGWGQILGGMGRLNVFNGNNAYDSVLSSFTAGIDRALDQNWRLGGALSLQRGILDWDVYGAKTQSSTLVASLYGSYDHNSWFVRSQLGGGGSQAKSQRDIPLIVNGQTITLQGSSMVTASSNATLPFFDGSVSTGYHFYYKDLRITPSGGLFYLHMSNNPFSETGAGQFNLYANRSIQDNLQAQGNLEVAYSSMINDRLVTFRGSYGLAFEALDKANTLTSGFLAFPDLLPFNTLSVSPGRWTQIAQAGMNVEVAKNVRLRFDYFGLFGRHQYTNMGSVGLKVVF